MPVEIQVAETPDQVEDVYRFRYRIHAEQLDRPQRYADHVRQQIQDPLDLFARHVVAYERGEIIGVIRCNLCGEGDFGSHEQLYGLPHLSEIEREAYSVTSRLIVAKHRRRSRLLVDLAKAAYAENLRRGSRHDLTDCRPPLPRFFRRLGYRTVRKSEDHTNPKPIQRLECRIIARSKRRKNSLS